MSMSLEFHPKWYHLGDPDYPIFAILYGAIAISTIYLLEYVSGRLLYSTAKGILLSDAAAQITYSSGSFIEFIKWFANQPNPRQKRLCRRALLGIFLRYLILCADVGILYLSIPRDIDVHEYDVGSTQLSYNVPGVNSELDQLISCKVDRIQYSGFTPKVARQICVSGRSGSYAFPAETSLVNMYVFGQAEGVEALAVGVSKTQSFFSLTHSMRIVQDNEEVSAAPWQSSQKILLPIPDNFVQQAANAFLNHEFYSKLCSPGIPVRNANFSGVGILCQDNPRFQNLTIDNTLVSFLMSVGTEKVNSGNPRVVGSMKRPRVCIIPAVLMLVGLISIAGLITLIRGTQDLAFKQWSYACRTAQLENDQNPLFCDDIELQLLADGSVQAGRNVYGANQPANAVPM